MDEKAKVLASINALITDNEIINYFDNHSKRIFRKLKNSGLSHDLTVEILHKIAKSLNNKERYSAIYYLFLEAYLPLLQHFKESETLNELKFELGKGLHHVRKYSYSKELFNELAISEFDVERIKPWWNQTVYKKTLDALWLKTEVFPGIIDVLLISIYVFLKIYFKLNDNSIFVFFAFHIIYHNFMFQYIVFNYLKEFDATYKKIALKKQTIIKVIIDLILLALFIPIYYYEKEFIYIFLLIIIVIQIGYYYLYFEFKFFPLNIIDNNLSKIKRKKANRKQF